MYSSLAPWSGQQQGGWGGWGGQRGNRQLSDPFSRGLMPISVLDSMMNQWGGGGGAFGAEMDSLERALEQMNQGFSGLVRIETLPDKTMRVNFADMDIYERTKIDYNPETNVLTVNGEHRSGNHVAHASRSVLLPCGVTNTKKIRAESRDGTISVIIPPDAQASAPTQNKPTPIKVNVTSSGGAIQQQQQSQQGGGAATGKETAAAAGDSEMPTQPSA